jgi:hypothetical protein
VQSHELVDNETVPVWRCASQGFVVKKVAFLPKERAVKPRVVGWAILVFVLEVEAKTPVRALPPCVSITQVHHELASRVPFLAHQRQVLRCCWAGAVVP